MKRIFLFIIICSSVIFNSGCVTLPKIGAGEGAVMAGLVLLKYLNEKKQSQPQKNTEEKIHRNEQATVIHSGEIDKTIVDSVHSYQCFDYKKVIDFLESLPKDKASAHQLLLIHQYLGASYYLIGNNKAEENFMQVLSIDKNFEFDSSFPSHLVNHFNQLKSRSLQK